MNGVCPAHNRIEDKLDEQIKHCHDTTTDIREDMSEIKIDIKEIKGSLDYVITAVNELKGRRRRFADRINITILGGVALSAVAFIIRALYSYVLSGGR